MKKYLFSLVIVLFTSASFAQTTDPVIMTVNGKNIKKSEFEYIYNKNNNEEIIDKKTLDEYVELFKNFKLKVAEAEAQSMDTLSSFRNELAEYRAQLAQTYLSGFAANEDMLRKAYDRRKERVEVSHILIAFSDDRKIEPYLPSDTLAAYTKAMQVRKRLLQKGADFDKMVMEVSSDTMSQNGNKPGYLGWITGMTILQPLEDAAYSTPVGGVSLPVRTNFGYHLIKVTARKADPGQVRASHILIMCGENADSTQTAEALSKVDDVYQQVLRGEDFAELAKKYSEDKGSAQNGGDVSWFGYGMMVPEFQDAAFALNVGEVSKPVRSRFGFHIIKLTDKRDVASFDELRPEILSMFERVSAPGLYLPGMNKLKSENGFSVNENSLKSLYEKAQTSVPTDSAFIAAFENSKDVLFLTGDSAYTIASFINFLKSNSRTSYLLSTEALKDRLQAFEDKSLVEMEGLLLEKKYPEFAHLMQEYRDGILLFNVSNQEVWNKAMLDVEGLKVFFDQNKEKYAWAEPHYKGYVVLCKDAKTKKKMQKEIAKLDVDSAARFLVENYKVGEVTYVKLEKGLFIKGDNPYVDELVFKTGKADKTEDFQDYFVMGKYLPRLPDDYTDVRGFVITDYQDYLEKEWLKELNGKYPVEIYSEVIKSVK